MVRPLNAAALLTTRVVGGGAQLMALLVAARRLDHVDLGRYVVALALVGLANLVVTFGVDDVVTRAVARGDGGPVLPSLWLQWRLAAGLFAMAAVGATAGPDWLSPWVLLAAAALVPMAVTSSATATLRGAETLSSLALWATAGAVAQLMVVGLGVIADAGLGVYVAAFVLGQAVTGLGLIRPMLRSRRRLAPVVDWELPRVAAASWRFAVTSVLVVDLPQELQVERRSD